MTWWLRLSQSDREKAEGLPVAPFMDREKVTKPTAQIGFIKFVLIPMFETVMKVSDRDAAGPRLEGFRAVARDDSAPPCLHPPQRPPFLAYGCQNVVQQAEAYSGSSVSTTAG